MLANVLNSELYEQNYNLNCRKETIYVVRKGSEFTTTIMKKETELTQEMLTR